MPARRIALLLLGALICGTLGLSFFRLLSPDGLSTPDATLLAALLLLSPWIALAFANALIGLSILLFTADPPAHVVPALRRPPQEPRGRTAIALCLRNEAMAPLLAPLGPLLAGLPADRHALWFLSDTTGAEAQAEEDAAIAGFRAAHPEAAGRVHLRRRARNTGFKAGNVMEFLDAEGAGYDYLLCLDADSVMTPAAVRRLADALDADPSIAILQQLIVGRPTAAPFPRLFQFGMRAGMRAWATGQGWWQGPKGPYWGHNALIRIAPFRAHARLELLPDGATILSHDQVEAVRLHNAGWGVWCLPEEEGSLEGNPPALPEFLARDLRWAAGNMQYVALLRRPGLDAMARFQLLQAILLFLCAPLWVLAFGAAVAIAVTGGFDAVSGGALALAMVVLWLAQHAPKLAGYLQLLLQPAQAARYGGRRAVLAGAGAEMVFSTLLAPISNLNKARFLLALPFGARMGWTPQNRADRGVTWADAARLLWPHSLAGLAAFGLLAAGAPWALGFALPWAGGLLVAIPFCVWTSSPRLSRWLVGRAIAATPEELQSASRPASSEA